MWVTWVVQMSLLQAGCGSVAEHVDADGLTEPRARVHRQGDERDLVGRRGLVRRAFRERRGAEVLDDHRVRAPLDERLGVAPGRVEDGLEALAAVGVRHSYVATAAVLVGAGGVLTCSR